MTILDGDTEISMSMTSVSTAGERGTCLEVLRLGHDLVDEGADFLHCDLNSVAGGELSRWVGRPQRHDVGGIESDVVADVAKPGSTDRPRPEGFANGVKLLRPCGGSDEGL